MDDENFLRQFEDGLLPMEQWHHREHIKTAYLYLRRYPPERAMERFREKLQALNAAHRVPDLPHRGYHETMTRAWLRLVHVTICEYGPAETADIFLERNPQLSEKESLRLFYSFDLLTSPQAKAEFVQPDLAPLPQSPKRMTDFAALK